MTKYVKFGNKSLKLNDKSVLFETGNIDYYFFKETKSKEFVRLPLENDMLNRFEELDSNIEKIIKQKLEYKDYKYNGFISKSINRAIYCSVLLILIIGFPYQLKTFRILELVNLC